MVSCIWLHWCIFEPLFWCLLCAFSDFLYSDIFNINLTLFFGWNHSCIVKWFLTTCSFATSILFYPPNKKPCLLFHPPVTIYLSHFIEFVSTNTNNCNNHNSSKSSHRTGSNYCNWLTLHPANISRCPRNVKPYMEMIRIHQLPVQDVNPVCSHLDNLFKHTLPSIAQCIFYGTIQPLGIQNHLHKVKIRCSQILYKHLINKQNSSMSFKLKWMSHCKILCHQCHLYCSWRRSIWRMTGVALFYLVNKLF